MRPVNFSEISETCFLEVVRALGIVALYSSYHLRKLFSFHFLPSLSKPYLAMRERLIKRVSDRPFGQYVTKYVSR